MNAGIQLKYWGPFWLMIGSFVLLGACNSKKVDEHAVVEAPQKVVVDEIPDDIRVPKKLWDDIEGIKAAGADHKGEHGTTAAGGDHGAAASDAGGGEHEAAAAGSPDELSARSGVLFAPVTVILKQHNPDVLTHKEVRIELPRGGGRVDIAKYIGEQPGSFFVSFEWPEWIEYTEPRTFFISRARKRKLDGDNYGLGCNKYSEISSRMKRENASPGIKVNTTRERHTTVLGGHFIFSAKKERQVFVTQVTFVDSKNSHLMCEETKPL